MNVALGNDNFHVVAEPRCGAFALLHWLAANHQVLALPEAECLKQCAGHCAGKEAGRHVDLCAAESRVVAQHNKRRAMHAALRCVASGLAETLRQNCGDAIFAALALE